MKKLLFFIFAALLVVLLLVVAVFGRSWFQTVANLQQPEIRGITYKWGETTAETTEVITTIKVYNPNSVAIPLKSISADVSIDGIKMGHSEGFSATLEKNAETLVVASTKIDNNKIPDFWAEHLKRKEKSTIVIDGKATFDLQVTDFSYPFNYTKPIETDILSRLQVTSPIVIEKKYKVPIIGNEITYFKATIESINVSWGKIDRDMTELNIKAIIHNDNPYPIPWVKAFCDVSINQIPLATSETANNYAFASDSDTNVAATAILNTSLMNQWFVSHVRQGEKSIITFNMSVGFSLPQSVALVLGRDNFSQIIWEKKIDIETDMMSSIK